MLLQRRKRFPRHAFSSQRRLFRTLSLAFAIATTAIGTEHQFVLMPGKEPTDELRVAGHGVAAGVGGKVTIKVGGNRRVFGR